MEVAKGGRKVVGNLVGFFIGQMLGGHSSQYEVHSFNVRWTFFSRMYLQSSSKSIVSLSFSLTNA